MDCDPIIFNFPFHLRVISSLLQHGAVSAPHVSPPDHFPLHVHHVPGSLVHLHAWNTWYIAPPHVARLDKRHMPLDQRSTRYVSMACIPPFGKARTHESLTFTLDEMWYHPSFLMDGTVVEHGSITLVSACMALWQHQAGAWEPCGTAS